MNGIENENAVSQVIAVILLVVLAIGIAMVIQSALMGTASDLRKSAFIASEADVLQVVQFGVPVEVLTWMPEDGDTFHLVGQKGYAGGSPVLLKVRSPDGRIITPDASGISGELYGRTFFIYPVPGSPSQCEYIISDTIPSDRLKPLVRGNWEIQLIDTYANILISTDPTPGVTSGISATPTAGGTAGAALYRSDCSPLGATLFGANITGNTGAPMNMTYRTFNGNSYLQVPDDPTLTFTGDLTLSVWLQPATISGYQQIIGKGYQLSNSEENKNYDSYIVNNGRLYFEWDDSVANTHYHIITNDPVYQAGQWSYTAITIQDGTLRIYVNGVEKPVTYYPGNNIGTTTTISPVPVNLKSDEYDMTVGKQNTDIPSNYFYLNGNIGDVSLYNRGLTQQEIQYNYNSYIS